MEAEKKTSETTTTTTTTVGDDSSVTAKKWDLLAVKRLLTSVESSLDDHRQALQTNASIYTVTLLSLLESIELSSGTKTRALTACFEDARMRPLGTHLLGHAQTTLPEVLKATKLLDSRREIKALEKRIERLKRQGTASSTILGQLQAKINDCSREVSTGSLSGAVIKKLKGWVRRRTAEELQFYALSFPKQPWVELADLLHLRPDDFPIPWFLDYVFGTDPPEDSIVTAGLKLNEDNIAELVAKCDIPYRYIRKKVSPRLLPEPVRVSIAQYTDLDTLIWYYEEICSPKVNQIIDRKLAKGEEPNFGYGKLMERLLFFQKNGVGFYQKLIPIAEKRLSQYNIPLEPPVSVAGDASASMQVAIETATIIASLMTALIKADLVFFNHKPLRPPIVPKTIDDVLSVATFVKANGATSPASALYPLYAKKEKNKFLIFVTDEEENSPYKGMFFADLLKKYLDEVNPEAKVLFMSFIEQNDPGMMVTELKSKLKLDCLQLKLSKKRPDLTKLDSFLGVLSAEGSFFESEITAYSRVFDFCGLKKCLSCIGDKKAAGRFFMVSLWASVLVDMIRREFDRQESREDEMLEALRNVRTLAEKSGVGELIAEVDDYLAQLAQEDYNDKRAKKEVMLAEVPKWEAKYRDPINNAFKPKAAVNEGVGTMSGSAEDDRHTALNPEVPVYMLSDEILISVFSNLDMMDLRNAGQVSQLFRRVSHDKTLWPILTGERGAGGKKKLDIAFCVDNTGSMGTYIKSAQDNILKIAEKISKLGGDNGGCDFRFALVAYRDHPPQDNSYVTKVYDFTDDFPKMKKNVDTMAASGGGDGPEEVACAFHDVLHLPWRDDATKICIFITDAPPHGLESSDGFPNGCPKGRDPIVLARQMIQKGIVIYSVSCEPAIGSFKYARDFLKAVADITEGQCISLANAAHLADVITGGAQEQLALDELKPQVKAEMDALPADLSQEEAVFHVTFALQKKGVKTAQLKVDTVSAAEAPFASEIVRCSTLKEAKANLAQLAKTVKKAATSSSSSSGDVDVAQELITAAQVARIIAKINKEEGK